MSWLDFLKTNRTNLQQGAMQETGGRLLFFNN